MVLLFHGGDAFPWICGFAIIGVMFIVLAVWLTAQFTGANESSGSSGNPLSLLPDDDERAGKNKERPGRPGPNSE